MTQNITLDLDAMLLPDGKRAIAEFAAEIKALDVGVAEKKRLMDKLMALVGELTYEAYLSGLDEGAGK